jgi:hypothetical protein
MHIAEILDKGKADADLPWEAFTYEHLNNLTYGYYYT